MHKMLQIQRKGSDNRETMFWTVRCLPEKEECKNNSCKENGIWKIQCTNICSIFDNSEKFSMTLAQCYK